MIKKLLFIAILALPSTAVRGQYALDMHLTGMYPGRVEFGMVVSGTDSTTLKFQVMTGLGWYTKPYVFLGLGLNYQLYRDLYLNSELYPVLSMEHQDQIDRGNNMVGDETMFGVRVRIGPSYTIKLLPELDALVKAGLELECPIFATENAMDLFQAQLYVGLGLILHTL